MAALTDDSPEPGPGSEPAAPQRRRLTQDWPLAAQYALALGAVLAALLVRIPLNPILGDRVPFITLFLVMLPLVLLVRAGPFLAATLLGLVGVVLAFRPRLLSGELPGTVELGLFVLAAAAAAGTARLSQRAGERERRADAILRENEARLRQREHELDAVINRSPFLLTHCSRDLRYQFVSAAYAAMLGRKPAEFVGTPIVDIMGPEGLKTIMPYVEEVLRGHEVRYETAVPFKDIGPRDLSVVYTPDKDASGQVVGWVASILDITDRKKLEQERAQRAAELNRALAERTAQVQRAERLMAASERMAAVGTMAAGLTHDMNNVLQPLAMRMESVLAASGLAGEARAELTVVVALIDHLRQMAANLSMFARDPEQEGSEGTTELAPWCRRVQGLLEASLNDGRRGGAWLKLKCDIPEDVPAVAIAPHRLTQAVLNLVENARDALIAKWDGKADPNRQPGAILIEARPRADGAAVVLRVIDDGLGMDGETKRRCIEPFFTTKDRPVAAGARGTHRSGSGIGLSLVHAMMERVGGSLEIASEPGRGTTVTLTVPVAAEAAKSVGTKLSAVTG